jgi:gliding motility-associated-like protein
MNFSYNLVTKLKLTVLALLLALVSPSFSQCGFIAPPITNNDSVYGTSPIKLTASGVINNQYTYNWYDDAGNLLNTDNYYTTTVSATTTYYVTILHVSDFCESAKVPLVVKLINSPAPGNPVIFGDSVWNVYCFNGTSWSDYKGYYIDSSFNINSENIFDPNESPCDALVGHRFDTYNGYAVNEDHCISYKRSNFPPGIYNIDIDFHDDDCYLYIDGALVFSHVGAGHGHKHVWKGPLNKNSKVEFRWVDILQLSIGQVSFTIDNSNDLSSGKINDKDILCRSANPGTLNPGKIIYVKEDAYVEDGSFANTAMSSSDKSQLIVETKDQTDNNFQTYLKFDISSIKSPVQNLKLYMYGNSNPNYPWILNSWVRLYPAGNSWNENTITWNTKPDTVGMVIDSVQIIERANRLYFWDVTNYINNAIAQKQPYVSFNLVHAFKIDQKIFFNSKESNSSLQAYLSVNDQLGGCSTKTYQWQSASNCDGHWSSVGTNSKYFSVPSNLTSTTCYRFYVTDLCGRSDTSNVDTVFVQGAGTLIADTTHLCADSNVVQLNLINYSGTIQNWMYSTDSKNYSYLSPVNTNATLTVKNSKNSIYYKAAILDGGCADTSNAVFLKVDPSSQAGTLTVTDISNHGGIITLEKFLGTILKWEYSLDSFKTVLPLSELSPSYQYTNGPSQSFRTIVKSGLCPADTSEPIIINDIVSYATISPNGDGINDVWVIDGIESYQENSVQIYNRWGELVYKQDQYDNHQKVWNGSSNTSFSSGSRTLPDGYYFYQIKIANSRMKTGYIILSK